jgi:formylglycine-generating enzyme required for sulfatase activity
MAAAKKEIDDLEETRIKLQAELNSKEMVLVPAAKVRISTSHPTHEDENPEHQVTVNSFYLDKTEITNLQYKEFVAVTGHRSPSHWRFNTFPDARKADHPIDNVSWDDAKAYAEWAGKRLPTEAEWERAALGDGRNEYPWGVTCSAEYANYDNVDGGTTPVEHFARGVSPTGIWDMCGNVSEWVNDFYGSKYFHDSPETDPQGPDGGNYKVHRGGAYHENRNGIRGKSRHFSMSNAAQGYIGFRCAMNEQPAEADD